MITKKVKNIAEELVNKYSSPLYVYDLDKIEEQFNILNKDFVYSKKKIHYAVKANFNIDILKKLKSLNCGIDAVSVGEVKLCLNLGFDAKDIIFTGNNISQHEIQNVFEKGILINFESLHTLNEFGKRHNGEKVAIRLNPDIGAGHHSHTITGGPDSKFGIDYKKTDDIRKVLKKHNLKLIGIHAHIGSGILDSDKFIEMTKIILKSAEKFFDFPLEFIDTGGGIGIPYKDKDKPINITETSKKISSLLDSFNDKLGKKIELKIEPGRFLVAEAGTLLTQVVNLKQNNHHYFVGINSGFNHLIRPAMYGSYHEILNLSNLDGEKKKYWVCGNICESGDIFGKDRMIAEASIGDVFAICDTGAYGYSMASFYNLQNRPMEIIVDNDKNFTSNSAEFINLI